MLVLTRKVGEQVVVGENIVVTVLSIQGNRIRLGIAAPDDIQIVRQELLEEEPAYGGRKRSEECLAAVGNDASWKPARRSAGRRP